MSVSPRILVVDDEPERIRNEFELGLSGRASVEVLHPQDVVAAQLDSADLVLIDYRIESWKERDGLPLSLRPETGLALAAIFRDYVDKSAGSRCTAFALHSAHLDDLRGRLPTGGGEHLISRLNNLEWAFPKSSGARWDQMLLLAESVQRLPKSWPVDDPTAAEKTAQELLGLNDAKAWFDRVRRNVLECQPPIHDLCGGAHPIQFLRWLLHQILPYPTFLWREEWVAARLRLTVESLRTVLSGDDVLSTELRECQYTGVLSNFSGRRWWRGALEQYVWDVTDGNASDVARLHAALSSKTKADLRPLEAGQGVVCLGGDFQPSGAIVSSDLGVRLKPDQWPGFADEAWTSIEAAKSTPCLRAVVDPLDVQRLGE